MKPGFCYLAEHAGAYDTAQRVIASFRAEGVVLVNPFTARITELADDGEQVETTEHALLQSVGLRSGSTFQLWFSSDTDVSCSFRRLASSTVRHSYSVDGLDSRERARLMRWAFNYFRDAAVAGTAILLVIDPDGITADIDWDDVVRQRIPLPSTIRDIFGRPATWMTEAADDSRYVRRRIGDCELLISRYFDPFATDEMLPGE